MIIREAYSWDALEVFQMMCLLENEILDWDFFKECYNRQFEDRHKHCIVAEQRGKIIGCLNLRIEYQLHHSGKIAEIMEFCVDQRERSAGNGKKLFNYAVDLARKEECEQLELDTNQCRLNAHRFYERQGMKNTHFKYAMVL